MKRADVLERARLSDMIATANAHGFNARIDLDSVSVCIPWYNPTTGATGETWENCRTWAELRATLGY